MWGGVCEQNVWCCENVEMIQDRLECGACGVKNNSTSGLWAECGSCGVKNNSTSGFVSRMCGAVKMWK